MIIAALDFETCNKAPGSICSIGLATYTDGMETETYASLIRPHPFIYADTWSFESIHGIKKRDVAHSPELPDLYDQISTRLQRADLVVCHWASFDIGQLKAALRIYQLPELSFSYTCTCLLARRILPDLPNHKLNTLAAHYDFPFQHHDALDDARAAGFIMTRMTGNLSLDEFREQYGKTIKPFH